MKYPDTNPSNDAIEALTTLEQFLKQPLPLELRMFYASGGSLIRCETDELEWSFPGPTELLEFVDVGRVRKPYVSQLEAYAEIIHRRTGAKSISIESGGEIPLNRFRKGWAIADGSGDVLFLDPESDFAVWMFLHDGMTIRRAASSLYKWLSRARKHLPSDTYRSVPPDVLKLCVEDALRDYIRHVLIPRGLVKSSDFLVSVAGHTVLNRQEGLIVEKLAELITRLHGLDPQEDRELRERLFDEISTLGQ